MEAKVCKRCFKIGGEMVLQTNGASPQTFHQKLAVTVTLEESQVNDSSLAHPFSPSVGKSQTHVKST